MPAERRFEQAVHAATLLQQVNGLPKHHKSANAPRFAKSLLPAANQLQSFRLAPEQERTKADVRTGPSARPRAANGKCMSIKGPIRALSNRCNISPTRRLPAHQA